LWACRVSGSGGGLGCDTSVVMAVVRRGEWVGGWGGCRGNRAEPLVVLARAACLDGWWQWGVGVRVESCCLCPVVC
jgi:hypothetical protein